MSSPFHIGLGSNQGDRRSMMARAVEAIASSGEMWVAGRSSLYLTRPLGVEGQEDFLNAVALVVTGLSPRDLLERFKEIERELGRPQGGPKAAPRPIDLDILLCGELVMEEPGLVIPHPRMHLRRFVLEPLSELDPEATHPVLGQSAREMLVALGSDQEVTRIGGWEE